MKKKKEKKRKAKRTDQWKIYRYGDTRMRTVPSPDIRYYTVLYGVPTGANQDEDNLNDHWLECLQYGSLE